MRRRKRAVAIAAAVISGLLGGAPGALAAPPGPALTAPDLPGSPEREGDGSLPAVWPRPQSMTAAGPSVPLGEDVTLVTDEGADPYAIEALRTLFRAAGARQVTEVSGAGSTASLPSHGLVVRAGDDTAPGDRSGAEAALRALRAPARGDLPEGGYRLAVGQVAGRDTVALAGTGADGLFHAAQTLRQLLADGAGTTYDKSTHIPGVRVRDWPGTAVRGLAEGFFGTPWSREQRLAQLDFMGRTKQNRYVYAPGDDPYRQARWREPYPAEQRADFRALAERARRNHVTLAWAVAPGQAMCMASEDDTKALLKKVDAMWALGVRAFQLQFQDVSYREWHCDEDAKAFGSGPEAAARAQARVAGAVAEHLRERYGTENTAGAAALSLMPTEYYQEGATAYRKALAEGLDRRVQVAWTGVGVVPRTITGRELAGAREAFGHPLVTMDNYPVNDFAQDRIFLGPYMGREPAVASGSAGLLANAMEQPAASRIPLFTAADYAWNPKSYRPGESWRAAVNDLAGPDEKAREAVRALAGNDASSVLGADESAYLRPLMDALWKSLDAGSAGGWGSRDARLDRVDAAGKKLRAAFTVMRETPRRLRDSERPELTALATEVRPWAEQLARYGEAGEHAVDLLLAQAHGDGAKAWRASRALDALREPLRASRVTVGKGVLDPFLERVRSRSAAWQGRDHKAGRVDRDAASYTVNLKRPRPLEAVTALTEPGTEGAVEAHIPGEGWRRLGRLSGSGWTETRSDGVRADAVRVVTEDRADRSAVHRVAPWFGDTGDASFDLDRTETDAEIGGPAQRVKATLASRRPGDVRGHLTAKPPKGIGIRLPESARLPRGAEVQLPIEVTVAPGTPTGTYEVPLTFGEETRTLTVRTHPRTGGPDLVPKGKATSSGDETKDFPASAAGDGDPETRWSSPAEDDAWWQVELKRPVRLGRVSLHWQDAYAAAYRIEVSTDGKRWRTAATVRDGKGGRESVRMDAKDVRFVRVQGEKRGTRFGYSLWGVEAYAVQE